MLPYAYMQSDIRGKIVEVRNAIRKHRDQKGDDRCWLDDYFVWNLHPDSPKDITTLPAFEDGMAECVKFFRYRQATSADVTPPDALVDSTTWDGDLDQMDGLALTREIERLYQAIHEHRDISGRDRTLGDDRKLYAVLPEKLPADFRLPPENEFLGEKRSGAGCPQFFKSHAACLSPDHNLHAWGPCDVHQNRQG